MDTLQPTKDTLQPAKDTSQPTKFCKFCAAAIPMDAVMCTACGRLVENLPQSSTPNIIINITATANAGGALDPRARNKWTSFLLCLFLGILGAHKFYEGKTGMGLLYLFTGGLFGIGWALDCLILLLKPNPYYV